MLLRTMAALLLVAAAHGALVSPGVDLADDELQGRDSLLLHRQLSDKNVEVTNLQNFTGALAGIRADPVTKNGSADRPFVVAGNTFPDLDSAAGRSCDTQKNKCAAFANRKGGAPVTVPECEKQRSDCRKSIGKPALPPTPPTPPTPVQSAPLTLVSSNADFDFFCET